MSEPFHIVERESFRVAGYCIHTTNKRKEGQKAIPGNGRSFKHRDSRRN